jgi:hypothetical protein
MNWKTRLREVFGKSVVLSDNLRIDGAADVILTMSARCAAANMQTDAAAFETWALATKVADARSVTLRLEGEVSLGDHVRRLHYRAARFAEIFGSWFRVETPMLSPLPARPDGAGVQFFLNAEDKTRRATERGPSQREELDMTAPESQIEVAFAHTDPFSVELKGFFHLESIGRQLPVGVFSGHIAEATKIFSGKKSAIDLWGLDGKRLVLFELKNGRNKKLGALTEIFFYSMVMRDVQRGILAFDPKKAKSGKSYLAISATRSIDAFILAPVFHPLIEGSNAAILDVLNDGLRSAGVAIRVGLAQLQSKAPFARVICGTAMRGRPGD